jgi:predicted metal-dependent hydrolase
LRIHPPLGEVRVSAPLFISDREISHFIKGKLTWIEKHQKAHLSRPQRVEDYLSGESHRLWGQEYILQLEYHKKKPRVEIEEKSITLFLRPDSTKDKRKEVFYKYYRGILKDQIQLLVDHWAPLIDGMPSFVGIKSMKTRWGSCNQCKRRIWLNIELVKFPRELLEYVVVHELLHFIHPNHGGNFKKAMDNFLPQWRELKNRLNQ